MTPFNQFFAGNDGNALEIQNSTQRNPADWFTDYVTGGRSDAGVAVNGYTALTHCPLWQGVNIIAGDLGQVPIRLVKDKFTDQPQHNAWRLLRVEPNAKQTPSVFIETLIQWALVWGNGVGLIERIGSRAAQIIPLRPDCLWYELVSYEGEEVMLYHYHSPVENREYTYHAHQVVHIQGLTNDGNWGYPLWQVAKNTIGFGLALQRHGNKTFSNGARPSGVLEHPGRLPQDARDNLRSEWMAIHGGSENAGKPAILWEGMKFNAITMTNIDSQWLEAWEMSAIDAARLLNLPAYKLNYTKDSSTRANLEEQNETYKQMTLTRWANRMAEEFSRKLLTNAERLSGRFQFVFDWDAFLMADIDTRTTIADRNVKATIWNPNEARAYLGYAPRPGGDEYGSPAINPNQKGPEDGKESPDNGRPPGKKNDSNPTNAYNPPEPAGEPFQIVGAISLTVGRERDALRSAARTKKNFIGWLDSFYGRPKHRGAIFDALDENLDKCGADDKERTRVTSKFRSYTTQRREYLISLCGKVTAQQLPEAVENFTTVSNETSWSAYVRNQRWEFDKWDSK